ncbi:MAG: chemotaxis protein CheD [Balneola sp.]|nr:chemotaxis protein CheD [Balneola sp.]|tara:strand:+ start:34894 stop:35418 length:525 start_codon:yes stop_codon:yes gene_type:complete
MRKVVGVSDLKVSKNPEEFIITHALGSCLGITAYDYKAAVGGMVHVMLPLSKADPEKAIAKPAMYVDTGFQLLLKEVYGLGARKENLEITVAGGASMKREGADDYFKIGKRNFTVLRKLLWKNGFMIDHQDVGGHISRTMTLSINNGLVTINKQPVNESSRKQAIANREFKPTI